MARGSVRRKDNGWSYRVDLGPDPATGKRRQLAKQGFRTRKEAEAALGDCSPRSTRGGGRPIDDDHGGVPRDWLASQQHRLRPTTLYSYEKAIERVTRRLGNVPLQALTPLQIEKFYAELLPRAARDGQAAVGQDACATPTSCCARRSPTPSGSASCPAMPRRAARPPTAARKEFATWSSDDLREFFAGIRDDRIFAAFVVLATTGMRRGEVLGLRWRDVDLDAGQLAIVQTLTTINGVPMLVATQVISAAGGRLPRPANRQRPA